MTKALLVGAGFSYIFGMPLIDELSKELRVLFAKNNIRILNQKWKEQGGGWTSSIVELFESLLDSDLHYEKIAGNIQEAFLQETNPVLRQELHSVYNFLLECIQGLLLERSIRNEPFAIKSIEYFHSLKDMLNKNAPLWVFSLNHDLILEMISSQLGISLKTGFSEETCIRMRTANGKFKNIHIEKLTRESIENNQYNFFHPHESGINLLKMHGSLDIFGQDDKLNYLKLKPQKLSPINYIQELNNLEMIHNRICVRDKIKTTNEITYYDEANEIQFLRRSILSGIYKFNPCFHQIVPPEFLQLFKRYLGSINELTAIGYSFGDKHIDKIIENWLLKSAAHILHIVDPHRIEKPFAEFRNQVFLHPETATDFFMKNNTLKEDSGQKLIRGLRENHRKTLRDVLLS